jgi:S-adenosylmethionine:tRNA ribosyltransferase-isomerase
VIAADRPVQRPPRARLLVVGDDGRIVDAPRSRWLDFVRRGDLLLANDAATLPASLRGIHLPTRRAVEIRLAAWHAGGAADAPEFAAVAFGDGDFRTRTEDRPPPPAFAAGDALALGTLGATVLAILGHPRLLRVRFDATPAACWRGLARSGRPIQYAHLRDPLALWDTWTPLAGAPVAFEPPSAGFVLDWQAVAAMRARGIRFATLTHAAGLSSTGDPLLDARLPLDETYRIPDATARAIRAARCERARIIAIGTTVVRAVEDAARDGGDVASGVAVATRRIGRDTRLRVVDGVVTGTHEPGSSHHELLRAFASDDVLARAGAALERYGYRTHEFGDSMLVLRASARLRAQRRGAEEALRAA